MLCLTRRPGEKIVITCPTGERVVFSFEHYTRSNKIYLSFDAPAHVMIDRWEVDQSKRSEISDQLTESE